uniref:NADH-ubiquinone oxidoreductase chain 4L n=1 Tax=Sclerophasma paresisense TaxID=253126 RepID=Q2Q1I6_9NEOP|nr:NADH dehydrogenase subunit 4L [Sclerophasma paresisense]ABB81900.1 NADH dehydrogenase subunit 4L [Sclerophasma paresisense]
MFMYLYMFIFMFFIIGLFVFSSNRKHLLTTLLSLEYIVLSLFMCMYLYLSVFNYEIYFMMMFIVFSVCEGALGLSILVSMIRTHGNDYFQSFSILGC